MFKFAPYIALVLAVWFWLPLTRWSWPKRLLAMALTWAAGVLPIALILVYRNGAVSEDVVVPLQVFSAWALVAVLLMVPLVLLRDAGWLLGKALKRAPTHRYRHAATLGALGLSSVVSLWGVWGGLRAPVLNEQAMVIPGLPPELDGLRVGVLADLHVSPVMDAQGVQTAVDILNAAKPDVVVLPGDMADGDPVLGAKHLEPLRHLNAPLGVWAAPGNHEYYSGYNGWAKAFRQVGMQYLENQTHVLTVRGKRVAISGVGDPAYGRLSSHNADPSQPEGVPPDVGAVIRQAAGADFHLLLAHQPKLTREVLRQTQAANAAHATAPSTEHRAQLDKGVDLQISGHTHGGHIVGMDRWVVAPANHGFVRGHYPLHGMQLHVSSGAGQWAGFTMRLGIPKTVDVLTLRAAP